MTSFSLKVTQEQVDRLSSQLATSRMSVVKISDNHWSIDGHHVKTTADFDPAVGELAVVVSEKPFYVSEKMLSHGIAKALGS